MQHIQKALKKAREKQAFTKGESIVPGKTSLERIVYTDTRSFSPSPAELKQHRLVAVSEFDQHSQIYRTLRTKVLKLMRSNNLTSLGITSPTSGEGKTVLACNLAIAMSRELNQSVLLVDLNLRKPEVAKCFSCPVEVGLEDYLEGRAELKDVLINPGIERLVLLPSAGVSSNSAELLSGPRMNALVTEIKKRYKSRIVIFDLPAISPTDDVLAASGYLDGSLLVVEDGKNSEVAIQQSVQLLNHSQFLGCVVNKSRARA